MNAKCTFRECGLMYFPYDDGGRERERRKIIEKATKLSIEFPEFQGKKSNLFSFKKNLKSSKVR